jgi:hypothetical protein
MVSARGVVAVLLCGLWCVGGADRRLAAQTAPAAAAKPSCGADFGKTLAGTWKAPLYKMKRASDVGTQVFGPNSFDVRDVELMLDGTGSGALKITSSVLDQKGKTWAATAIETKITVGAGTATLAGGCEAAVMVTSAEERFLDETQYRAPLTGAHVMLIADPMAKQLDVRFEPPMGQGSFWTTLRRQAAAAR